MQVIKRSLSYFLSDWKYILALAGLVAASIGLMTALAWPMAILIDLVLTKTPKEGFVYDLFRKVASASPVIQILSLACAYLVMKFLLDLLSCLRAMLTNSIKYRG